MSSELKRAALDYHQFPKPGKISVETSKPCDTQYDLSLAYTPGVAEPVRAIAKNPEDAYKYTDNPLFVKALAFTSGPGAGPLDPDYDYTTFDEVSRCAIDAYEQAGVTDPRVTYWEPAKWVAKLRDVKTDGNLLLLKTNMGAGHGGASGRFDRLKEVAFVYAFGLKVTGLAQN